jgi:hypothetical protein
MSVVPRLIYAAIYPVLVLVIFHDASLRADVDRDEVA